MVVADDHPVVRGGLVAMLRTIPGLAVVEHTPECRVLILTMYDDDATVFTAMQAGAQGYLLKEAEQDDIVRAVHGVVAGEAIFGPGVAARVRELPEDGLAQVVLTGTLLLPAAMAVLAYPRCVQSRG